MTKPHRVAPSPVRRAAWLVGALIAAGLLFAPLSSNGFCADSVASAHSYCVTTARSLLGIETSLWLWIGASVVLCSLAWWIVSRSTRDR